MQKMIRVFLAAAALLSVRDLAEAQALTYSLLPSQDPQPSPRFDGAIAYSPASGLFAVTGKYWPMLYTGHFVEAN